MPHRFLLTFYSFPLWLFLPSNVGNGVRYSGCRPSYVFGMKALVISIW